MNELVMFAGIFAAYGVLHGNTFGGPGAKELFNLQTALIETLILLTSSFTCGLAILAAYRNNKTQTLIWFGVTLALGLTFLAFELTEFSHLVADGNSWQRSAFLSSFFTLVGTHGLHITFGSLWIVTAMTQVWSRGLTPFVTSKLTRLSLFWHFLDVVWIFIFTIVYLMGHVI